MATIADKLTSPTSLPSGNHPRVPVGIDVGSENYGPVWDMLRKVMPGYASLLDYNGNLQSQYALTARPDVTYTSKLGDLETMLGGIQLNTDALQELRSRGMSKETSPWAKMLLEKQAMDQAQNMDSVAGQGRSALATGMSALATRGGASSGARERLANQAMRAMMSGRQGVRGQGASDRLGIMTQDEQSKLDILKALPGMETEALQPEIKKTDIWANMAGQDTSNQLKLDIANRDYSTEVEKTNLQSLIGDVKGKNQYEMDYAQKLLEAWGNERTAQATENSGKK